MNVVSSVGKNIAYTPPSRRINAIKTRIQYQKINFQGITAYEN